MIEFPAQGPHSHILMTGVGEGVPKDFFRSEILAKRDYFWVYQDAGIFLSIVSFSSAQINKNISTINC